MSKENAERELINVEDDARELWDAAREAQKNTSDPVKTQESIKRIKRAKDDLDDSVERLEKSG